MIEWIILAILGAGALAAFWSACADTFATWLRQNGLAKSWLMDATVWLERVGNRVRRRLLAKSRQYDTVTVEETTISLDDVPDEVRQRLRASRGIEQSVLAQIQ